MATLFCSSGIGFPTRRLQEERSFPPILYRHHHRHRHHANKRHERPRCSPSSFLPLSSGLEIKPRLATAAVPCIYTASFDQFYTADQHDSEEYEDSLSSRLLNTLLAVLRDLYSVLAFLWKQPRELKYLEFPSLHSAGTMALFTVGVVMVLIVILASVDSGLGYFMARLFSRIS